ncbi:hypothetical protein LIER_16775 [Lithospermum erythrorhizon]|uniref:DUF4283 domain-containing protein n=1 Tax=Lithospermum erythrorhizon TaxID=34254 RepID=A0AAV3QAF0_LITER
MNCSLIEEEAKPVMLEEEDLIDGVVECEASAFVKIHALKLGFVSLQNFTLAMAKAWNCKDIRVSRVAGPVLHVFFPSIEEKLQVMESRPWCFDNHLIIIKNWTRGRILWPSPLMNVSSGFTFVGLRKSSIPRRWQASFLPPLWRVRLWSYAKIRQGRNASVPKLWASHQAISHFTRRGVATKACDVWPLDKSSGREVEGNLGSLLMASTMRNHRFPGRKRRSIRRVWWWRKGSCHWNLR